LSSTPPRVEPVVQPVAEPAIEPVVQPVAEPAIEPVDQWAATAAAPVGGWIADPEPVWLRSLEPVAQIDDPTMIDAEVDDPLVPALVLAGRPSIPAPAAAPLHDLMADLDLSSILAKVASPVGPPLTAAHIAAHTPVPAPAPTPAPSWQSGTVAPRATTTAPAETEIHRAIDLALAGIEAATRKDEVVDQHVHRQPAPMAPSAPPPSFAEPTLAMGTPTLPIAPQRTAPPAPAPAPAPPPPVALPSAALPPAPAPTPWADAPALTTPSPAHGVPTAPPVLDDEPARSGGFRRLIGGGNR
jgi:hypothetical protein